MTFDGLQNIRKQFLIKNKSAKMLCQMLKLKNFNWRINADFILRPATGFKMAKRFCNGLKKKKVCGFIIREHKIKRLTKSNESLKTNTWPYHIKNRTDSVVEITAHFQLPKNK